jgi:aspartyl protease family protein
MSSLFDPVQGPIVVTAELEGPTGISLLQMILDTGATTTLISSSILMAAGYNPAADPTRIGVTTANGLDYVASLSVSKLRALGHEKLNLPVLVHTLPPSSGADGLLGLDFLRGLRLTVDFRTGLLTCE